MSLSLELLNIAGAFLLAAACSLGMIGCKAGREADGTGRAGIGKSSVFSDNILKKKQNFHFGDLA